MDKGKRNKYKFWHSPIVLIALFIVLVLFGYKMIDLIQKEKETSHKKELILNEIANLRQREVSLSGDISKLKTEEGQEEVIREKLPVAKPNEKMVTIVDEEKKIESSTEKESSKHSFIEWLKNIFKK